MKTTGESGTYCLSKIELADVKYYLGNVRNCLIEMRNNKSEEKRKINLGVAIYNIEKAINALN